jgi:hypothetical protein
MGVTLGDTRTVKPVYGFISLSLELHYKDQLPISADVNLCIMDMEKNNVVIGLPDVIEKFFYLFNKSLREELEDSKHHLQIISPDRCLPRIISLNDYPMEDKLSSELTTDQTDTTPFPNI